MLATLVYKLTGECEEYMKTEKIAELEQLICPAASTEEAVPCRYEFHAVCNQTAEDVSKKIKMGYNHVQILKYYSQLPTTRTTVIWSLTMLFVLQTIFLFTRIYLRVFNR